MDPAGTSWSRRLSAMMTTQKKEPARKHRLFRVTRGRQGASLTLQELHIRILYHDRKFSTRYFSEIRPSACRTRIPYSSTQKRRQATTHRTWVPRRDDRPEANRILVAKVAGGKHRVGHRGGVRGDGRRRRSIKGRNGISRRIGIGTRQNQNTRSPHRRRWPTPLFPSRRRHREPNGFFTRA